MSAKIFSFAAADSRFAVSEQAVSHLAKLATANAESRAPRSDAELASLVILLSPMRSRDAQRCEDESDRAGLLRASSSDDLLGWRQACVAERPVRQSTAPLSGASHV